MQLGSVGVRRGEMDTRWDCGGDGGQSWRGGGGWRGLRETQEGKMVK